MQLTTLLILASASAIAADAALRGAVDGSGANDVVAPAHGNDEAGSLIRGWRHLDDKDEDKEAGSLIRGWRHLDDKDEDKEAGSLIRGWRNLEDKDEDKEAGSLIRGWRNLEDKDDE